MRLQALSMQGFKSFADHTELRFDAAITAVVGPNGSGKSNVADAIRWVLGEQSSRALRGSRMEDVIFGGTKEMRRSGQALVTLTLENEDGALPTPDSVVSIARRYDRAGDSSYLLNRKTCRLRDVSLLLMDTGMGQEGYSHIGQGKIDEILAVKSSERRSLFEEAAGISLFRHRKEESERKLKQTEENLLRLTDKMEEIALTLGPLEQQAALALRYEALSEELQTLEVSLWLAELGTLRAAVTAAEERCTSLKREQEAATAREMACYEELERGQMALARLDEQLEVAREQRTALMQRAEARQREEAMLGVRREKDTEQLTRLQRIDEEAALSREASMARIAEKDALLSERQNKRAQLAETLREQEVQAAAYMAQQHELRAVSDSVRTRQEPLVQRLSLVQQQRMMLEQSGATEAEREAALSEKLSLLAARYQESVETLSTHREALQLSETELAAALSRLQTQREEAETLRLQVQTQEEDLVSRQREAKTMRERLDLLAEMEAAGEGYSPAVKSLLRENVSGVHGPVASLIMVKPPYETAIETALGAAMQHVVVETQAGGKAALRILRERRAGRLTCLPMDVMRGSLPDETAFRPLPGYLGLAVSFLDFDPMYTGVMRQLLGRVLVFETLDEAMVASRRLGQRQRLVTLTGEILSPGGAMTGGFQKQGMGLARRAEALRLRKASADKEAEAREAAVALADAVTARDAAAAKLMQREAEHRACLETRQALHLCVMKEEMQQSQHLEALREAEALHHRFLDEGESGRDRLQDLLCEEELLREQIEDLGRQAEDLREALWTKEQEATRTQQNCQSLGTTLAVQEAELRFLEESVAQLRLAQEQLTYEAARRAEEMQTLRETLGQLEAQEAALREEGTAQADELREFDATLDRRRARRLQKEAEQTRLSRTQRSETEARFAVTQQLGEAERHFREKQEREHALLNALWEQYELTHETASAQFTAATSPAEMQTRLTAVKRERTSLGLVNRTAPEEYVKLKARHDEFTREWTEIDEAAQQLRTMLGEIIEEMRTLFLAEFQKIGVAFAESFEALFGGGTAKLRLEDVGDVLSSGIEIEAQPPGKKLRHLSLLSGGERALVAIALSFAILKVRPAPFCVLDEIDAALDDANVQRFAAYLRKLANETQFIVITHRRGTMEVCDLIYGVTMEQKGVSKLLALDLREARLGLEG